MDSGLELDFEGRIGYKFKNKDLLVQALTHRSFASVKKDDMPFNNERLEFLGDAVLEIVISEFLFLRFPKMPEGELTKLRANIVCEPNLAVKAKAIDLGAYLILSKSEEQAGGRYRGSILADTFEAVAGAVYLDGGIEEAKRFLIKFLAYDTDKLYEIYKKSDYKSYLQEVIQKSSQIPVVYNIIKETGPGHDKFFEAQVIHVDQILGYGSGKTKKEAEQNAAFDSHKRYT